MIVWYLCDLKTGSVITDLPLRSTGEIERTVGTVTSLGVELDVHDPSCPANWAYLIDPMRAMLVLCDDDQPLVGYTIDQDEAGEPAVRLTLSSLEGVLDAVYVRTHDFYQDKDDEADAAAALLSDVVVPSFGFELAVTPTGQSADHSYLLEEDRTVGAALSELMAAAGGPEWTVRLGWADSKHQRIIKTIRIGPRVGSVVSGTIFENHHLIHRLRRRAFAHGNRAIYVLATSDGSGIDRPSSAPYVDQDSLDRGIPQWEARVSVPAIDDDAQLDRIAVAALSRRRQGLTTWEMELALSEPGCPRVGRDFDAGDTVQIQSDPMAHDPITWYGQARVIGWRASIAGRQFSTVTPIFWEPTSEVVA